MRGEFDAMPVDLDTGSVNNPYGRICDFGSDTIAGDKRDRVGHEVIIGGAATRAARTFLQHDPRVTIASGNALTIHPLKQRDGVFARYAGPLFELRNRESPALVLTHQALH